MDQNKIDKFNMREVIIDSPKQLAEGLELARGIKVEGISKKIIVCGMGGSALPADILRFLGIQIYVHRDYGLPKDADKDSLVICISYSGNTEETLSALEEAIDRKLKVVCIASGGKIEELCKENNIPLVKIKADIPPRMAVSQIFSTLVKVLENSKVIEPISLELKEVVEELEKIKSLLEKEGQTLAKKISGRIPIIYSSDKFGNVAKIWKIKFNENSKIPSFYNVFPELNHNEMVGYTNAKKDFFVIMLRDSSAHERNQKRMELTSQMLRENNVGVEIIDLREGSLLFKIFSCLLLSDWTSYYLAIENKVDPTPVKMAEEFKKLLRE